MCMTSEKLKILPMYNERDESLQGNFLRIEELLEAQIEGREVDPSLTGDALSMLLVGINLLVKTPLNLTSASKLLRAKLEKEFENGDT